MTHAPTGLFFHLDDVEHLALVIEVIETLAYMTFC